MRIFAIELFASTEVPRHKRGSGDHQEMAPSSYCVQMSIGTAASRRCWAHERQIDSMAQWFAYPAVDVLGEVTPSPTITAGGVISSAGRPPRPGGRCRPAG